MLHTRDRWATKNLLKRLKFFRVVAIQGARQTGKSFLAKHIISKQLKSSRYLTLDSIDLQSAANRMPQSFLSDQEAAMPLMIDEAQKAPPLFDAIKLIVDNNIKPGQFILLGSSEFSHLMGIRESLTGRMGRLKLLPMTLMETLKFRKSLATRAELLRHLAAGGMPGIFAVRDSESRSQLFEDWISLVCDRDIHQIPRQKLDSRIANSILRLSATLDEPTQANMAKALRVSNRKVEQHLHALCSLFVLNRLDPHPLGTGKAIYLPLDTGIANFLGASLLRRLHIFLLNERIANSEYFEKKKSQFFYFRSTGKRMIHLIEENQYQMQAFEIQDSERILKTDALLMEAFLKRAKLAQGSVLSPISQPQKVQGVRFVPWESALFCGKI